MFFVAQPACVHLAFINTVVQDVVSGYEIGITTSTRVRGACIYA